MGLYKFQRPGARPRGDIGRAAALRDLALAPVEDSRLAVLANKPQRRVEAEEVAERADRGDVVHRE